MNLKSNNNSLKPSLQIPKPIQYFAKFLQFMSPKLAILFAAKLFTTPVKFSTPKKEIPMDETSQKTTLKIDKINKDIHVLKYGYSDKKILLAHGWAGRRTQLFMIANKLLEKGFMVVAFDAPAHGKSTGKTTNMIEYIETIKAINNEFGPFEAAVGHSFGGMAIVNTNANTPIFKSMVTIGSADKVKDIIINFTKNLGLKSSINNKLISYIESKWNVKVDDFGVHKAAKKNKTPTLVVHDIIDGDVTVSCAVNIRQNLKNGSLLISNGLGHTKILRDKRTIHKIVDFISKNSN